MASSSDEEGGKFEPGGPGAPEQLHIADAAIKKLLQAHVEGTTFSPAARTALAGCAAEFATVVIAEASEAAGTKNDRVQPLTADGVGKALAHLGFEAYATAAREAGRAVKVARTAHAKSKASFRKVSATAADADLAREQQEMLAQYAREAEESRRARVAGVAPGAQAPQPLAGSAAPTQQQQQDQHQHQQQQQQQQDQQDHQATAGQGAAGDAEFVEEILESGTVGVPPKS
jgi:hypothetical protein